MGYTNIFTYCEDDCIVVSYRYLKLHQRCKKICINVKIMEQFEIFSRQLATILKEQFLSSRVIITVTASECCLLNSSLSQSLLKYQSIKIICGNGNDPGRNRTHDLQISTLERYHCATGASRNSGHFIHTNCTTTHQRQRLTYSGSLTLHWTCQRAMTFSHQEDH